MTARLDKLKDFLSRLGNRRVAVAFLMLCLVMITIDRAYYWWLHPLLGAPDQSLYLDTAKWIMEGKVPYRDFFDWNPPLIMFLSMVPQVISQVIPLHPITSLNLLMIFLAFACTCLSLFIAYRYMDEEEFFIFVPMLAGASFYVLNITFDTGEREQIFAIVYLPFLVLRYIAWTNPGKKIFWPVRVVVGIIAGFGLALKPQFVAAAAGLELVFLLRKRRWKKPFLRLEVFGVLIVMAVYAYYLFFLMPKEAWDVLKNEVIPLFVYGYDYSKKGLMYMLHGGVYFIEPMTRFCFSMSIALFANRYSQWAAPVGVFTLISLANYLHGDQAWVYRMIPMEMGALLLWGLGFGLVGRYLYDHSRAPKAVATCLVGSLVISASCFTWQDLNFTLDDLKRCDHFHNLVDIGGYLGWCPCSPMRDLNPIFGIILKYSDYGGKVLYVGTGISDGYPAIVQSGRRSTTRYPFCAMIMIDHCIINRPEAEKAFWLQMMYKQIEDYRLDIARDKPELILILDYLPFIDMLQRYGFFQSCMGDYTECPKEHDVRIFLRHPKEPYEPTWAD